jgi:hypothetical protein
MVEAANFSASPRGFAEVKQVPDSVNLTEVFDEHKFGGARIRPVRMDPAMTGQLTRDGNSIGMKMVWTLLIEQRVERGTGQLRRGSYKQVITLVAEEDEGLPKLLRDVADLIERGETKVKRTS